MNPITTRALILVSVFAVVFTAAQPFLPASAAETAHAADLNASPMNQVDDPRVLYLFSQMEMALGDVGSAVRLADRAAKAERNRNQDSPRPAKGTSPCNSQSRNLQARSVPIPPELGQL